MFSPGIETFAALGYSSDDIGRSTGKRHLTAPERIGRSTFS
jgi:hypothetical protein